MTPEKANELLVVQVLMGGGYTRNGGKPVLAEIPHEHGQDTIDSLISTLELEKYSVLNSEQNLKVKKPRSSI